MRNLTCCLVLAGCAVDALDATTTPAPGPAPTIFDRLHDDPGPVAGLDGYSIVHAADPTRCGGVAVSVVRDGGARIAPDDQTFAALLEAQYPTGLVFSWPTKEASYRQFKTWLEVMNARVETALGAYTQQLGSAADEDRKVAALARRAQVARYFASVLARGEIPLDVRSGAYASEQSAAVCDALANAALPLLDKADDAATTCGERAARLAPGWWTTVCTR